MGKWCILKIEKIKIMEGVEGDLFGKCYGIGHETGHPCPGKSPRTDKYNNTRQIFVADITLPEKFVDGFRKFVEFFVMKIFVRHLSYFSLFVEK